MVPTEPKYERLEDEAMFFEGNDLETINTELENFLSELSANPRPKLKNPEDVGRFLRSQRTKGPSVYLLSLSSSLELLAYDKVTDGDRCFEQINIRDMARIALKANARYAIYVHCLKDDDLLEPGGGEMNVISRHARAMNNIDVRIVDYYRISSLGYFSMVEEE